MIVPVTPDIAPHTGNIPIRWVSYSYQTPAIYKTGPLKGDPIAGWWFNCTVPAIWHGHVNLAGHKGCVLFHR